MKKFNKFFEKASKIAETVTQNATDFYKKTSEQISNEVKSDESKLDQLKKEAKDLSPEEFKDKFNKFFNNGYSLKTDNEKKASYIEKLKNTLQTETAKKMFFDYDRDKIIAKVDGMTSLDDILNFCDMIENAINYRFQSDKLTDLILK